MNKNKLQSIFDKICVKLHNEGIGNIDVAYIDYDETPNTTMVMKPVFVAFKDRDILEYFKLAFTADSFELRPTIDNPFGDPTLVGMKIYQTVKSYYLQWRKQQLAGGSWDSQSKTARTYAREDAKQTAALAKLAASGKAYVDPNGSFIDTGIPVKDFGTASHTSPWEDPLVADIKARDIAKQYDYMMEQRMDYVYKAVKLLQTKRKLKIDNPYLYQGEDAAISCDLIEHIDRGIYKIRNYSFDIPNRMFDRKRHLLDTSVHIPAEETYLSEGHLILRLAYIIYKATQLRDRERINNEVIKVHNIELREGIF